MNHFFLWVGPQATNPAADLSLLDHYKTIEPVVSLQGKNWSLTYAAQRDGLGAHRNDRRRVFQAGNRSLQLIWFGHAWSGTDGAQPPFSAIASASNGGLSNRQLIKLARESCNGVFALVLIDESHEEILVSADALGSYHIYQRELATGMAVSNSSALLAGLEPHANLDPIGVQELCSNSVANEDRSIWDGVRKLRSWQIASIDARTRRIDLDHHRPLLSALDGIRGYAHDPVPELFKSISEILLTLDKAGGRGPESRQLPWVVDLTGGNDSRALMAAILANNLHVVSTVTGPASDPDVRIGEHLAKQLGIRHFTRPEAGHVTAQQFFDALRLTDAEFDAVEYSGVAAVHRQHILDQLQFSMNGSYAELGRGHAWRMGLRGMLFPDLVASKLTHREPLSISHPSVSRWAQLCALKNPPGLFSEHARAASSNYFAGIFGRLMPYAAHLPQHAQLDLIHADLRMERWQGRLASSTNQLWPAISPWGFQGPLAQLLTSSPTARRNGLLTRAFTLAYAPDLARERLYTGNPAMPFSLKHAHRFLPIIPYFADRAWQKILSRLHRDNTGQAPSAKARQPLLCTDAEISSWLREPLLAESRLFDKDALIRVLSPDQPQSDRSHRLWCRLLTLEAALRHQGSAPSLA